MLCLEISNLTKQKKIIHIGRNGYKLNPRLYKWNFLVLQILIFVIPNSSFYEYLKVKKIGCQRCPYQLEESKTAATVYALSFFGKISDNEQETSLNFAATAE